MHTIWRVQYLVIFVLLSKFAKLVPVMSVILIAVSVCIDNHMQARPKQYVYVMHMPFVLHIIILCAHASTYSANVRGRWDDVL